MKDILYKSAALAIIVFVVITGLVIARNFLIPLTFAAFLAMMLSPLAQKLEHWGFSRFMASLSSIALFILALASIISILGTQTTHLKDNMPKLLPKLEHRFNTIQCFIERTIHITPAQQITHVKNYLLNFIATSGNYIKNITFNIGSLIAGITLTFIYSFFFLNYTARLKKFLFKVLGPSRHAPIEKTLDQVKQVGSHYIIGIGLVSLILGTLTTLELIIIGIPYAFLFGILVGVLEIMPYIGGWLGFIIVFFATVVLKDSLWYLAAVILAFGFNQLLESNFLTPYIVGSQVSINPLFSVIALVIGGYVWGLSGIILFIPLLGIVKVIFDTIEPLKPYGYLIGTDNSG